ncbi:MAG: BtpA/SgcQ family protein [Longimicrobiales bacterium]
MIERIALDTLFGVARPIVGMVHLHSLPGAPAWAGSMNAVLDAALADAAALTAAGVHGMIVENYGDVPFFKGRVPPETIAAMTVAVDHVRRASAVPIGINVLRNDAAAALAIVAATGAAFIRVNVHTGAVLADQGWIEGRAHETLRSRRRLGLRCAILADVAVKHAFMPPGSDIRSAARDAWRRGRADALIVSGPATGLPTGPDRILAVREAVTDARIWIGSGLDEHNIGSLLPLVDGAIVGSALCHGGTAGRGIDPDRAQRLLSIASRT